MLSRVGATEVESHHSLGYEDVVGGGVDHSSGTASTS